MIGQKLFATYLSNWTIPPHFIILNGEVGSGRSTIIEEIKKKFKYKSVLCGTSTEEVRQIVDMAYTVETPVFYIFYNGEKLSSNAKNVLLKVVEEQPKNAFFIMRTESGTIETLKNRSFYYNIQPYSSSELKEYFSKQNKEDVYDNYGEICKNIGQIKIFLEMDYEGLIDYCDMIVTKINRASQGNVFNITRKIDFGDNPNGWDAQLFINALEWKLKNAYKTTKEDRFFQAIFRLNSFKSQIKINGVNKSVALDNFLLGLRTLL